MATSVLCVGSGVLAHPSVASAGPFTWTYQQPQHNPLFREQFGLAYDSVHGTTVLFGGEGLTGTLGDTWTWDGSDWTQQAPPTPPEPRADAAMAFDPRSQQVVLFGGRTTGAPTDDMRAWDGSTWNHLHPATTPPPQARPRCRSTPSPAI
jgi:hypothetical protein